MTPTQLKNERRRRQLDRVESWKSIPDYEGLYEVSNLGAVRSVRHAVPCKGGTRMMGGRARKLRLAPNGYHYVLLSKRGTKRKLWTVHTLIMAAFIGPRPAGMYVCHNDGDGANSELSNLRYDTPRSNEADKFAHGTMPIGQRSHLAKLTDEQARRIRRLRNEGMKQKQLAAIFGVHKNTISDLIRGRRWRHVQ